jgi:uncharacterized membrane protein YvlD (DUF360 family)
VVVVKEKFSLIVRQFNWRMLLMRVVMYTVLLLLVVLLTPNMFFDDKRVVAVLITAIAFGLISAVVRPIVQFFTLPFIFATYGLVVVFVNMMILLVLDWVRISSLEVNGILAAIIGAILIGLFGSFLESMMGLTMPIVPDSEEELRQRIKFQDRSWAYRAFRAAPAELQKYAPQALMAEPLPSSPDTQDAEAILATLNATQQEERPPDVDETPPEPPPARHRRLRKTTPAPEEIE